MAVLRANCLRERERLVETLGGFHRFVPFFEKRPSSVVLEERSSTTKCGEDEE
jgi:hypothetical protein